MRKLLLASAAILGATGGLAFAQPAPTTQGQVEGKWMNGPAANNNNNAVGTATKGATMVPTPGNIVVRLNGRVETEMHALFTSADKAGTITGGGSFKVNPINFSSYMRLYPGVDGLATNGLRYGAAFELRQNFGNPNAATAFTSASGPSAYSVSETVYVRRAFVYMGSDQVGILRIGQTDGVIGLFDNGTFTSQGWDGGVGNFNGGAMQASAPGAGVGVPFAWLAQAGNEYDNAKIVYLTPNFAGFDFGLQYAPSMGNGYSNSTGTSALQTANCSVAGASCNSVSTGNDATRWLNQVAVGGRYQGSFAGVDVGAYAVYMAAGKEAINGGGVRLTGLNTVNPGAVKYDNLSFVNGGVYVRLPTVGLTWAIDYNGGAVNGQLAMRPAGGAPENAVVTGLVYKNGPWTLGAEVGIVESQGATTLTKVSQRKEVEVAFGGTYSPAPGLSLVLEFMHTERHQGNFDFIANGTGTTRDVKGNGLTFATIVTW
jgi:hypothetical protein